MSERNAVQRAVDDFGRRAGFEKRSGTWYRLTPKVIAAVNLQKSQYGRQYYLNVGFWLRDLGDECFPKIREWHVVARLENLLPGVEPRLGELLDLDSALADDQRYQRLVSLLDEDLLQLVEQGGSLVGLRSMQDGGTFKAAAIRGPAHQLLMSVDSTGR
jgi:hypothetical protein